MRRLAAITLVLLVAGAALAVVLGSTAQGSSSADFDVIFDDARGLVPGQLVKVAGANAGTIQNVTVTSNFKAKVEGTIDSRFMPFHTDATCAIRPQGLIAENYVDCDPGTLGAPPLRASGGNPPTVSLAHTTEPVSLLDLFNMFNAPTQQRFSVIVNELGIGTAGRGDDFNDILRRANPALSLARQIIAILARQKGQLASIISNTNTIAAEAAGHTANLQRFLDRSASLATLTAAHRDQLSQSIARLPALLAQAQPALQKLDTVAVDGSPLLAQLRVAAPPLNQVTTDLGPFVKVARPGLADLGTALKRAIPAIRDTTPVVKQLATYTHRSLPGSQLFARLSKNLQQHGFVENFLSVVYYIGASLSRFDNTSHMLAILLIGPQNGVCGNYATKPTKGCSAHYFDDPFAKYKGSAAGAAGAAAAVGKPKNASSCSRLQRPCARGVSQQQQSPTKSSRANGSSAPGSSTPSTPASSTAPPPTTNPIQQSTSTLQSLVSYLLK
jgi:virulence factor Mce-like protein